MHDISGISEIKLSKKDVEKDLLKYCKEGNYQQVVFIFDKLSDNPGFNINCRDNDNNTPLILAAKRGHGSIVQELLRHNPDITLVNKNGQTVVNIATNPILKLIFGCVSTNMPYSDTLFCNACWLCNIEVVERCIAKERHIIPKHLSNLDDIHCLLLPILNLHLIESSANRIKWPFKPVQVILALLGYFTDSHPACRSLLQMVSKTISKSSLGIARVLLQRSFDVMETDESGFNALHFAARSGNIEVLDVLVTLSKHNTMEIVDVVSKAGYTPLHLAAMEGRETCVKLLLDFGASKEMVNDNGYTPMQMSKNVRIKNLFQEKDKPQQQIFFPEASFVLTRSNTALPRTPAYNRSYHFGKKSAEPYQKPKNSLLEPEEPLIIKRKELFRVDDPLSSSLDDKLFPDPLHKLPIISSRPTTTPERPKFKVSQSISLDCLVEETSGEPVDSLHTTPEEDVTFLNRNKITNGKVSKLVKNYNKTVNKTRTEAIKKPKNDVLKPVKSKLMPLLNKTSNQIKRPRRKQSETVTKKTLLYSEPLPIENIEILSDFEAIYESDFNTDNSSIHEECQKSCTLKSESEEDDQNKTLNNSYSSGMSTHINWRKGEQLGKGSYGTVWKGMLEDGQYIAVKEIIVTEEDELSECSINSSKEIKREIDILQTLSHRNIVKYLGSCDSHTCIHIFMEFVSGGSIAYILSKFGGFSENIVKRYSRQIIEALTFLDKNDVIHRDIKGANVMVTPKGVIKLIDFGCAKKLQNFSSVSRSVQNQSRLHGSVYWMAPEVINGTGHSHKSDVWSLGCTVVEMITTRPPWVEMPPFAAMFAIGSGNKEVPSLRGYETGDGNILSDCASDFVNLCLIRDKLSRPKSADLLKCSFFN